MSHRIQCVVAVLLFAGSPAAQSQQEVPPEVISPLRIESDHNNVNMVSGKIEIPPPVLSVPAAPNLRFDRWQNAAPHVKGKQSGGADTAQSTYSVHTGMGTSESFHCVNFDCASVTGSGSTISPNGLHYNQGGSGVHIHFDLKHVETTGNPSTMMYYASSATYPNGETLTYAYDTTTPQGAISPIFHRPNRVTSNLGYFISISYHPGDLESGMWSSPAQATLYKSSAPTIPLGSLAYNGTTITDMGGRVYSCSGCLGFERDSGWLQLPGESSPTIDVTAVASSFDVVAAVSRDGVPWNYTYTNLRNGSSSNSVLYDRVRVTGPLGYDTIYDMLERDFRNVIERITDSNGRVTEVDYDTAYRLRGIVYPEGNEVSVVYDNFGNITKRTTTPKPGSGQSAIEEDAHYPTSSCNSVMFDVLCNRPTWFRDALGRQTDFLYNAAGQLTRQTDPADMDGVRRRTIVTYETSTGLSRRDVVQVCAVGSSSTCGTSGEFRTEYDYWENTFLPSVERRIDAAQGVTLVTTYDYDDAGRLKVEDGPLNGTGDARYFHYDDHGRREWEIGPADANGIRLARKITYRDADDKVLRVEEGSVTNPTAPSLAEFRRVDHAYDARRNPSRDTLVTAGATQTVLQRTFDQRNRLQCEARRMNPDDFGSPPGSACTLGPEGDFGPDRITRNFYDDAGQLEEVHRAYGTPLEQVYATYTYSLNGKRRTVKDANNNLSTFEYDGFDRLQRLRFPLPTIGAGTSSPSDYEQYGYDAVGNRTSLRKRDGKTITYTYDALNRVDVKTVPTSTSLAPGYSVHYRYDVRGLLTHARFTSDTGLGITNTYDGFGRLRTSSSNMGGTARTVTSDYDAHGNRRQITHPDGKTFEYEYDSADNLLRLLENGTSTTLASIVLDAQGRRDWLSRGATGAITDYDYDPVSRLTILTHDLDGTGTTVNDAGFGFAYNPASQIITRAQTNEAYEFPLTGAVKSYAANGLNQYSQVGGTTHLWDANGNLKDDGPTTFGYDTENRLVDANGAQDALLSYDPLGRLYQVSGTSTTRFVYDGDRLIAEYSNSGSLLRRYVHGPGVDEPLVWYEGAAVSASTRRYLHADHQGSIVAASNASGTMVMVNAYDAYGITGTGNTGRFQYTGQAAVPELGLLYYKARFYNPALGRFMQTDPIGYDDDVNLYAYVYNDPLNRTDPTGNADSPRCPGNPSCPITGKPQQTYSKGVETTHARNSQELMDEMMADATKEGETVKSGSYNESGKTATKGAIDSRKRADAMVESTGKEGTTTYRAGEALSPGQTEESQKAKWDAEKAKLPSGAKLKIFVKAASKVPVVGAVFVGGRLIFDDSYMPADAVGDLTGSEPAQ